MYEIALASSVICFIFVAFAFGRSRAFSVFHPLTFYLAFHGLVFVFRPLVAHAAGFDFVYRLFQFTPSLSDKITVIFASNLGFLVFAAACWRAGSIPMRFKFDRASGAERTRLTPPFLWIVALCVPIGAYSLSLAWSSAVTTGVAYAGMVRDAATGYSINTTGNGYLVEAQLLLATCTAIFAWLFRFRLYALLPLVLYGVYRAGTGGRGPFITALATAVLFYLYDRRQRFPSVLALAIVPVLLIAFTAIGDDRGAAIRRAISADTSSEVFGQSRAGQGFLEGMDFANMEYFEYLVYAVPQRSGTYSYFNEILQVFTEPVPRVLWKDKPIGAPFQRIHLFDYGYPTGMTSSLPGAGWIGLGWAGVVIWCGLWGWMLGAIYRRFVEGPQTTIQVAAYMVFVPVMIVAFRDGQLVTVFRQGLFFMAPIVLWWLLGRAIRVPALPEVRALLRRQASPAAGPARPAVATLQGLPAAVARRRLALQAEKISPAE